MQLCVNNSPSTTTPSFHVEQLCNNEEKPNLCTHQDPLSLVPEILEGKIAAQISHRIKVKVSRIYFQAEAFSLVVEMELFSVKLQQNPAQFCGSLFFKPCTLLWKSFFLNTRIYYHGLWESRGGKAVT